MAYEFDDYRVLHDRIDSFMQRNQGDLEVELVPTDVGLIQETKFGPVNNVTIGKLEVPHALNPTDSHRDWTTVAWYGSETFPPRLGSRVPRQEDRQVWLPNWGPIGHIRGIVSTSGNSPLRVWQRSQDTFHAEGDPSRKQEREMRANLLSMFKAVGAVALDADKFDFISIT